MTQNAITCEHIISSLKTLGFGVTRINENLVSMHKDTHKIRISRGVLDPDREARMRRELPPLFAFFKKIINASTDTILLSVRDWLVSPSI